MSEASGRWTPHRVALHASIACYCLILMAGFVGLQEGRISGGWYGIKLYCVTVISCAVAFSTTFIWALFAAWKIRAAWWLVLGTRAGARRAVTLHLVAVSLGSPWTPLQKHNPAGSPHARSLRSPTAGGRGPAVALGTLRLAALAQGLRGPGGRGRAGRGLRSHAALAGRQPALPLAVPVLDPVAAGPDGRRSDSVQLDGC